MLLLNNGDTTGVQSSWIDLQGDTIIKKVDEQISPLY